MQWPHLDGVLGHILIGQIVQGGHGAGRVAGPQVLIPALMIIFQLNRIDYFPTIGETSNASISVWLMVLQVPKYNEITILTKLIQE